MKSKRHHINIKFYTKPNCSLCEKAKVMIGELADTYPLKIEEINILSNLNLYEKYKHTIPVVVIDDTHSFASRVDPEELQRAIIIKMENNLA